jgi:hypothetical protein
MSTLANPLVVECGMKETCDTAVIIRRSVFLLEQDVCYLSVLVQLGYKEQFRMSRYEIPVTVSSAKNGP